MTGESCEGVGWWMGRWRWRGCGVRATGEGGEIGEEDRGAGKRGVEEQVTEGMDEQVEEEVRGR
jgi:hypothetical protein